MKNILTTLEASQFLGMSRQFLERNRWKGATIPFVRIGSRTVRYRLEDLEAYLYTRVERSSQLRTADFNSI